MTGVAMSMVAAPVAIDPGAAPAAVRAATLDELCRAAGIPCRVTIGEPTVIELHVGNDHYRYPGAYLVGIGARLGKKIDRITALRILEILAYGFFDYGARECICGRGLFVAVLPVGRPPRLGRAASAAERMRAMRRRRVEGRKKKQPAFNNH